MIQILMPLAGSAKPFANSDSKFPKALVEVMGHPHVEYAVRSAVPVEKHQFHFVVRQEDVEQHDLGSLLEILAPGCTVTVAPRDTAGALCTCMLAIDKINMNQPLIVCNGDQYIDEKVDTALENFKSRDLDVGIISFKSTHPRWSFVRLDDGDLVEEVSEKRTISDMATIGIYYLRNAELFFEGALQSLLKNVRYNEQFYVAPSFNALILNGRRIGIYQMANENFFPLGIPEDVEEFKNHFTLSPLTK